MFYKPQGDYDYVYVLDSRGWYYRYAHLKSIDPAIRPGERVKTGRKIGAPGKEGSSGGWAHLHFDIKCKQPSGKWGILDAYAFLWEAYRKEYQPRLLAVARPHHLIWAGEKVTLDGSRSWSASGRIPTFEWTFGDGSPAVEVQSDGNAKPMAADGYAETVHRYAKPGHYIVSVERTGHTGATAVTRLHVNVE